jgi:hypothetical protein
MEALTLWLKNEGITINLRIVGKKTLTREQLYLLAAYLPGVSILSKFHHEADVNVTYVLSDTHQLLIRPQDVMLYDRLTEDSLDLHQLLYCAARTELISQGCYPAHAACVGNEAGYFLLTGESGSGKTSTMLELVDRYGLQILSGNKTSCSFSHSLDGIIATSGTKTITLKAADLKERQVPVFYYQDRAILSSTDDSMFQSEPRPIRSIYLVKLSSNTREIFPLPLTEALIKLYPLFLDVMNAEAILCHGDNIYTDLTSDEAKRYLLSSLKKLLGDVKVFSVTGPLAYIADEIAKKERL